MKLQKTKLGFTLIELMVVITIIGILATGGVSVYTSQIQKARDSNRITSIKALQSSVEQLYSDVSVYADPTQEDTAANNDKCSSNTPPIKCITFLGYMPQFPTDPKTTEKGAGSALDYMYTASDSTEGVDLQVFEVSTGFEAKASVVSKASDNKDSGNDANRFESGNNLDLDTKADNAIASSVGALKYAAGGDSNNPKIVIKK